MSLRRDSTLRTAASILASTEAAVRASMERATGSARRYRHIALNKVVPRMWAPPCGSVTAKMSHVPVPRSISASAPGVQVRLHCPSRTTSLSRCALARHV